MLGEGRSSCCEPEHSLPSNHDTPICLLFLQETVNNIGCCGPCVEAGVFSVECNATCNCAFPCAPPPLFIISRLMFKTLV